MKRTLRLLPPALVAGAIALVWMNVGVLGQGKATDKPGEWTTYGGDLASTRYSPADQINKDNFSKLEVAWRFKGDSLHDDRHAARGRGARRRHR